MFQWFSRVVTTLGQLAPQSPVGPTVGTFKKKPPFCACILISSIDPGPKSINSGPASLPQASPPGHAQPAE